MGRLTHSTLTPAELFRILFNFFTSLVGLMSSRMWKSFHSRWRLKTWTTVGRLTQSTLTLVELFCILSEVYQGVCWFIIKIEKPTLFLLLGNVLKTMCLVIFRITLSYATSILITQQATSFHNCFLCYITQEAEQIFFWKKMTLKWTQQSFFY